MYHVYSYHDVIPISDMLTHVPKTDTSLGTPGINVKHSLNIYSIVYYIFSYFRLKYLKVSGSCLMSHVSHDLIVFGLVYVQRRQCMSMYMYVRACMYDLFLFLHITIFYHCTFVSCLIRDCYVVY